MEKVAGVLDDLHAKHNVAHLDVRLENTCFELPDHVVMIDFDRYMPANEVRDMSMLYDSVMYEGQKEWMCKQFDWKQLGIMIAWVISGCEEYHNSVVLPGEDEFLQDLLYEGQFFSHGLYYKPSWLPLKV